MTENHKYKPRDYNEHVHKTKNQLHLHIKTFQYQNSKKGFQNNLNAFVENLQNFKLQFHYLHK